MKSDEVRELEKRSKERKTVFSSSPLIIIRTPIFPVEFGTIIITGLKVEIVLVVFRP